MSVSERCNQLGCPQEQLIGIVGLQRVLIGGIALPPAGANVLHRVEEEAAAGYAGEAWTWR